jgi:CheY-like chemotaxis protein/tetratricopeptide (TPR) repeat protein
LPGRVLCVDADRSYCEILARTFRAEGYDVHTAHDGESALQKLRTVRPDLVTLEVLLPKRDGFSVLEALRAEPASQATPVLLLTGCSPTPAYRQRAQQLGAIGLLSKPVPLDRLLGVVAEQFDPRRAKKSAAGAGRSAPKSGPAKAAPLRGAAKAAAAIRRPALAGSLREVPFAALLHHLHGLRATGVVHLESGKKKKKVQFEDGRAVSVKSNLVNETLGNLLASSGRISLDVMHESLLRVKRGEGLQGQILVAMHMLDEEDLALALRTQAEEKILEIFSWTDGTFRFDRGVRLTGGNTLSVKGSPANLIARGVLTRVPPETIDAFMNDHGDARVAPSSQPFWRFQDVDLDDGARKLFDRIDGGHSLLDLLPLDERARRLLYVFSSIEMIEFVAGKGAPRREPEGSPLPSAAPAKAYLDPEARPRATRTELPAPEPIPLEGPDYEPPMPEADVERGLPPRAVPPRPAASAPTRPAPAARPAPEPRSASLPPRAASVPLPPARPVELPPEPPLAASARRPADDASLSAEEEKLRAELMELAKRIAGRDYYAVLSVGMTATDDQIREAYFALAKRTHPDRFSGASEAVRRVAEEVFAVISQAYETLGHRDRRNEYLKNQRNKERDKADIEEGERALKAEMAFQKGITMLRKKSYSEASTLFKEACECYPNEGEYFAYYGWAMYLSDPRAHGRVELSRNLLVKARKLAPSSDKPYLFLGRLYKAEGKDGVAEKMFQKVIELDPDCVDAIRELRLIDMRRQRSKGLVRRILRR